jgi:hypothetical protein
VTRRSDTTEAELAEIVIGWLEDLGADVYQEVECSGGVADIVARVGAELWIVETKVSLSVAVLYQAMERRRSAHRVIVAGPYTRHARDFGQLCEELGVGLLVVYVGDSFVETRVEERVHSRRWNTRPVALASRLQPQHKTHAKAGAIGGGRWTPFRATCEELERFVRANPGTTLKVAIDGINHHYRTPSSARNSMRKWIEGGRIPGIRVETKHGAMLLHPRDA